MISKLIILLSLSIVSCTAIRAQEIRYNCVYRTYCEENVFSGRLDNCDGYDEDSYFMLSNDGREIIHFTQDLTSIYSVHNTKYYPGTRTLSLRVTSDAGNDYEYVIDETHKKIKVYFLNHESEGLVAIFTIGTINEKNQK